MVQLAAHESLEVVYLYRPTGMTIGERVIRGMAVKFRDGTMAELESLATHAGTLCLFITTPQQYEPYRLLIQKLMERDTEKRGIGFILVEDPLELATLRLRKRIQHTESAPWIVGDVRAPYTFNQVLFEINQAGHHLILNANQTLFRSLIDIRELEAKAINDVGHAMTSSSSVDDLMRLILEKALELTTADAGFLLLRENLMGENAEHIADENTVKLLRRSGTKFLLKAKACKSQNVRISPNMLDPHKSEFTAFVTNRACGISWAEGMEKPVFRRMDYGIPDTMPMPEFDFDPKTYEIRSYCTFPLKTPSEEVVGLIFLLNRRPSLNIFLDDLDDTKKYCAEFNTHDLNLLESLASQAAVSIDHTRLYKDLKTVFESFVQASVTAIESRDPTTKGHSERVAILTVGLAEAVNRIHTGPYSSISFGPNQLYELKYASLLHDFGKIGVREDVLRKEKKLYSHELQTIKDRFSSVEKQLHLRCLENYLEVLMKRGEPPTPESLAKIRFEIAKISGEFSEFLGAVLEANEPHVVNSGHFQKIADIAATRILVGTESMELLSEAELKKLSIRKGSLSVEERSEIESHVTHSYRFLIQIPWTNDFANIPDIVYAHHERLDGSGYPRQLIDDAIPVQARLMAITDIYDALVAMDRPYKKALPHERALSILEAEVKEGKLDRALFNIFVEAKIGDLILPNEGRTRTRNAG